MKASLCEMIKSRATLRAVGALLNIEMPRDGRKFRSPFRPDKSPSCTVKGDVFTDWSTGEHLDQIDFYTAAKDIPRPEAIRDLARIFQIVGDLPARSPARPKQADADDRMTKAQKRAAWPAFQNPSREEIRQIAELRGLGIEGVQIAADRGLLFCVTDREARAWAVTDSARLNARIRRMDGRLWYGKSKSMPPTGGGQESFWPVGILEAQAFPAIAIVEGEGEILAAFHLAWCAGVESCVAVVGMLGSGDRISDEALPLFAGKRVRIFEDNDAAGERAAMRWAEKLLAADAMVDSFSFGGLIRVDGHPMKDMTDFAHICPDQWKSESDRIESAFNFAQRPPGGTGRARQ